MKKLIALLCLICMGSSGFAQTCCDIPQQPCEEVQRYEHTFYEKGATSNQVAITNLRNIVCKGNKKYCM